MCKVKKLKAREQQPITLNIEQLVGRVDIRIDHAPAEIQPGELREKIVSEVLDALQETFLRALRLALSPLPEKK